MEMTFPHMVSRQDPVNDRQGFQAMLATAIARQANSRTAKAVTLASRSSHLLDSEYDTIEQRIRYFGSPAADKKWPSGAFWSTRRTQATDQSRYESGVYQDASMNSKAHTVNGDWTGEQFNQAGHGASRTL